MTDPFGPSLADESDYARVVYYGDPGSGKTTAASGLARLGKTLVYPFEPGLKKTALLARDVPVEYLIPRRMGEHFSDADEEFWSVKENGAGLAGASFDTMTAYVDTLKKEQQAKIYAKGVREADARGEEYTKPKTWMPRETYGEISDAVFPFIGDFSRLPLHLAWLAHVRRDEDDDGEVSYGPAVTPAIQKHLIAWSDVIMWTRRVGRYDDGRPVFLGTVADSGKYVTKDRTDTLPSPHLVYPSMDRIVAYLNGDLTEKKDKLQQEFLKWADQARKES